MLQQSSQQSFKGEKYKMKSLFISVRQSFATKEGRILFCVGLNFGFSVSVFVTAGSTHSEITTSFQLWGSVTPSGSIFVVFVLF